MKNFNQSAKLSPFQFLKQNIHQLRFDCDAVNQQKLQTAFGNVLQRLDQYFTQNQLYEALDYDFLVQNLLQSKTFHFGLITDANDATKGFYDPQRDLLAMNSNYLDQGTQTEGMLCHEFIHYLTLGQKKFIFRENDQKQETLMRSRDNVGYALITDTNQDYLVYSRFRVDAKFIWEGWTELLKQEIYPPQEATPFYMPCITMLDLWNGLTSYRTNLLDFLRFNFVHLVNFLDDDYDRLCDACVQYDQKLLAMPKEQYQKYDWRRDAHYFEIQDIFCQKFLQKAQQKITRFQGADLARLARVILDRAPAIAPNGQRGAYYQVELAKLGLALANDQSKGCLC